MYDKYSDFRVDADFEALVAFEYQSYIELRKSKEGLDRSFEFDRVPLQKKMDTVFAKICDDQVYGLLKCLETPVGFWKGAGVSRDLFESMYVYVDSKYRGRGYSIVLKQNQLEYARNHGYKTCLTTTTQDNIQAIALLLRTGHTVSQTNKGLIHATISLF